MNVSYMKPYGNIKKVNKCISYYIGGGWGEETPSANEIPAFVIRGTDIPNLKAGNISSCPLRFHKQNNFKNRQLMPNDIVLEVSGGSTNQPVGRSVFFKKSYVSKFNVPVICASFCKLIRVNAEIIEPKYLYYWLEVMYTNGELGKYQIQSTGISNFQFEAFIKHAAINIPDPFVQHYVVDVLTNYDDLVENNNRRIELLEKAAQEIYKEWFVRFRFPGYENAKFVNGLPEGWTESRIGDVFDVTSSKRVYLADYVEHGIPFYRSKEIIQLAAGEEITEPLFITDSRYNEFKRKFGAPQLNDILITSVGTIGVSYLVYNDSFYFKDGNLTWIKSSTNKYGAIYLHRWLNMDAGRQYLLQSTIGTSQSALTIENLKKIKFLLPTQGLLQEFYEFVEPMLTEKRRLQEKTMNLKRQRDLLLPRLMSGNLEV